MSVDQNVPLPQPRPAQELGFLLLPSWVEAGRKGLRLTALTLLVLLAPGLAFAQINPFRGRGADRLTGDDVRMITETSDKLLNRSPLPTGASETWHNPQTGASGRIKVNNTFRQHGLTCHTVAYEARTGAGPGPRTSTLVWCRTQEGAWKIAS